MSRFYTNLCAKTFVVALICSLSITASAQNNCLNFDGIGDEVDCGTMTPLDSVTAFTLEAWVKVDTWVNFKPILGKSDNSNSTIRLLLGGVQGRIIGLVGNGTNAQGWTQSTSALPLNTWTHIAMVYDGTATGNANRLKLYVNGTIQTLIFQSAIPATTAIISNPFHICEADNSSAANYDGKVDEVRIWTTALSATNINAWKNIPVSTSHPNSSDLSTYYMMDDPATPLVLADSAGSAPGSIFQALYDSTGNVDFCYPPNIHEFNTNPSCFNTSDGSINLTVNSIYSPFTYVWSNGSQSATNSGISGGNYQLTITDDWGCEFEESFTLTAPPEINVSSEITHLNCFDDSDGSIETSASGGIGSLSYLWSNSETDTVIDGLSAGIYVLTVTDSTGCTVIDSLEVTQPNAISINFDSVRMVTCAGGDDGTASISVSGGVGGYSISWSDSLHAGMYTATGLGEEDINVTVIDQNGCIQTEGVTIGYKHELPDVNLGPDITPASFPVQLTPGSQYESYLWFNGSFANTVFVSAIGHYWVVCEDSNGCFNSDTIEIKKPLGLASIENSNKQFQIFPNPSNGQLNIRSYEGASRVVNAELYSISGKLVYTSKITNQTQLDLSGYSAGVYLLKLETDNGHEVHQLMIVGQ